MKKTSLILSVIAVSLLFVIASAKAAPALPTNQVSQVSGVGTLSQPWTNACSDFVTSAFQPGYARVKYLDVLSDAAAGQNLAFYTATNVITIAAAQAASLTNLTAITTNLLTMGAANSTALVVVRSVASDTYQALHIKSRSGTATSGEPTAFAWVVGDKVYQMTANGSLATAVSTELTINAQGGTLYNGKRFSPEVIEVVGGTNCPINLISVDYVPATGLYPQ